MEPITTATTLAALASAWKLLGSLYEKYQGWSVRKKTSKEAQIKQARASVLMKKINRLILSGHSSDDPEVADLVKEFRNLVAEDVKPQGYEITEKWVNQSHRSHYYVGAGKKPAAKKPMAKKAAAKKPAAKKPASKKPAAKKP